MPSSVTLPTSKTPSASLNCRGRLHTQPTPSRASCGRRPREIRWAARADSDILIHAPPKHPHASPAAPACGPVIRGPGDVVQARSGRDTSNRPWQCSSLSARINSRFASNCVRRQEEAMAILCPKHCPISCPIPSVRVCRQPCQIVSDPRIWKCKTPRRAEQGLFRGSYEPQTARHAREPSFQKTPLSIYATPTHHLGPSGHPGCPIPSPPYSQPIVQHSPSCRSCRGASVLPCAGASYRGGLHFRVIRDLQGRVRDNPVASGIHQPTRLRMAP